MATIEEITDGETGDEVRVAVNNSLNNLNADKLETADYISRNKIQVLTSTEGEDDITLSGEQTLNGFSTSSSRVLVMEQTLGKDNGIYVTAAGAWARSTDADTSAKVRNGMQVSVVAVNATVNGDTYILSTADPIILGTTSLSFGIDQFAHKLGDVKHLSDTLANLNLKVSGGNLDFDTASRPPNGTAAGDLSGSYPNPTVNEANVDHDLLSNYVLAQHRIINDSGSTTTELLSASKILAITAAITAGVDNKAFCDTSTEGVGNITLSGEQTLNGLLTSASRVLVTEQTLGEDNGFYTTAAGSWSRTTDADSDDEMTNGVSTMIDNSGSDVYRHHYLLTTADPITVGTTPLTFDVIPDIEFGTGAGTATEGNDARIPIQDENDALVGTNGTPSTSNKYVTNSDPRLATGSLAIVQARRTTTIAFTATFDDVTFDTTDIETAGELDHDAVTDRIIIGQDGNYLISYYLKGEGPTNVVMNARIRKNDTTVLDGSEDEEGTNRHNQAHNFDLSRTITVALLEDDFISLQIQRSAGSGGIVDAGAIFNVVLLEGKVGVTGTPGATGATGPAGETLRDQVERFYAGEFDYPTSAGEGFEPAPLDIDHTFGLFKHTLDDTTAQGVLQKFRLKDDVNTAVSVVFNIKGKATSYVTNSIVLKMKYWLVAPGASLSPSPTTVTLGTFTMASGAGQEEEFSVSLSYATLTGWAVDAKVRFVLYRDTGDGADDLVGDFELTEFSIEPPRV